MKHFALPFALSLAAMVTPMSANAHEASATPIVSAGHTLLSVSADGQSARTPDLAVFSAGVTSQGKTAAEALAINSADMSRVVAELKKAGIADKDIQTSNISLNPIYGDVVPDRNGVVRNEPRIIGYQASNSVSVKQRDLTRFGKVLDALVGAGANQVNGPSFQLADPETALDEARVKAMAKARARADLYARAAGLKVVRILSISEGGGFAPPIPVAFARAAVMGAAMAPPVEAGEVESGVSVTVQFELAP